MMRESISLQPHTSTVLIFHSEMMFIYTQILILRHLELMVIKVMKLTIAEIVIVIFLLKSSRTVDFGCLSLYYYLSVTCRDKLVN